MSTPTIDSPEPEYIASMIRRHIDMPGIVSVLHKRTDDTDALSVMELLHVTFHQARPTRMRRTYPHRVKSLANAYYAFHGSIDGLPYTIRDGDRMFDVSYSSSFFESLPEFVHDKDYSLEQFLNLIGDHQSWCAISASELLRNCLTSEQPSFVHVDAVLEQLQSYFSDIICTPFALPCPLRRIPYDITAWLEDEYPADVKAWQHWVPFFEDNQKVKQKVWAVLHRSWVEPLSTEYLEHIGRIVRRAKPRFMASFNECCREEPELLTEYATNLQTAVEVFAEMGSEGENPRE